MPQGRLIMASGHLGHSEDIPQRSLAALREADVVVFEEDRVARQLLKAAGVHRTWLRYTEHQEKDTLDTVREALRQGKRVVYMSDQGTPGLADPGRDLVAAAYAVQAKVQVVPGPSSVTAAIAACPFDCARFRFAGFLPREDVKRKAALAAMAKDREPVILLDTPYRLAAVLEACKEALPGRRGFVALDVTGEKEDYWLGSFEVLVKRARELGEKLNFVLVIEGA